MTCSNRRVLHLAESLDLQDGGPSKSIPSLYKARHKNGFKDLIATVHLSKRQINSEFRKYSFQAYFGKLRISPALVYFICRERKKYDIIHINCVWNFIFVVSVPLSLILRKKIIISTRGMLRLEHIKKSKLKSIALNFIVGPLLKYINRFHVTSSWEAKNLVELGLDYDKITLIYNSISETLEKQKLDIKYQANDTLTYLYVGRMHPYKRVLELVDAYIKLPEYILKSSRLKLVGPQPDPKYLRKIKDRINAKTSIVDITLHNYKNDIELEGFFQECSVLVMPSKSENFGMTILEALQKKKIVVVPELSPWPEILSKDLMEVVYQDASNLIDCLLKAQQKVVQNSGALSKIDIILKKFEEAEITKQFTEVYESI